MKLLQMITLLWTLATPASPTWAARTWTDSSGAYTLEAELVTFNERSVVLQRADAELVALPVEMLSPADLEYLKSKEAEDANRQAEETPQAWTLKNGTKVTGRVVDFADRDVVLQQRRRRIYVNDRFINNLPEFYQQLIPAVVANTVELPRADRRGLQTWLSQQAGAPQTFHVQGVVIESENGDEYAVPFFLFSDEDLKALEPGWNEWQAAWNRKDFGVSNDLAYLLRSLAAARAKDQRVQREIAMMQLKMQAVQAGVTSLWEVTLHPAAGQLRPPQWVVVPGRDSRQATNAALEMNPGYVAGPVRRVSGN